jgi:Ternary complex associated domain 9
MPTDLHLIYPAGFDSGLRARIDEALRELSDADAAGSWSSPPTRIRIGRLFEDGHGGALVLSLEARWDGKSAWYVAKIGPAAEMREEWQAYRDHVRSVQTMLYAPIDVVSRNVLGPVRGADGEDGVVLYRDVADWAGIDAEPRSLEHIAAAALSGSGADLEAAVRAVTRILRAVADVFCVEPELTLEQQGRTDAKAALGPDLRLLVTGLDVAERPDQPAFRGGPVTPRARPDHVVAAGLVLPGAEPGPDPDQVDETVDGGLVTLDSMQLEFDGDRLLARRHEAVVELVFDPPGADPSGLERMAGDRVTVRGRILSARSRETWERATAALPGLTVPRPGAIELDGVQAAHPFAALRWVLRERRSRVLAAGAHGDLNTLNVLVVGDLPFLIDYARAGTGQPVLKDPAWLELNLLRHPLGDQLTFPQLVRVQRLLLLGGLVAELNGEHGWQKVVTALADLVADEPPAVGAAVRILAAVRGAAQRVHRHPEAEPCWREYQVELLLAAHRAAKWSGGLQTPGTWRAQLAAAAVAGEALDRAEHAVARHWPADELAGAAARLLPLLPDSVAALEPLAAVVGELTVRQPAPAWSPTLRHEVRAARARLSAAAVRGGAADKCLRERRPEHERFLDLQATILRAPPLFDGEADGALAALLELARAVVLGPSGAGKTTLLRELYYQMLDTALGNCATDLGGRTRVAGRLPVWLEARDLISESTGDDPADLSDLLGTRLSALIEASLRNVVAQSLPGFALLAAGAVHLLIDDVSQTAPDDLPSVLRAVCAIGRRFTDVPVTLAVRGAESPLEPAEWSPVRLHGATRGQAEKYLIQAWRGLYGDPGELSHVVRAALDARARPGADRWNPGLLPALAALHPDPADKSLPRTYGDYSEAYYTKALGESQDGETARYAQDLARLLTGAGENQGSVRERPADAPPEAGRRLVEAGILVTDGSSAPRFENRDAQDYFAARWLCRQTEDPQSVRDTALDHRWYGPAALLVSLAGAPTRLREDLVTAAMDADPVQAGRLLRCFPNRPRSLAELFLDRQEQVLRDTGAGRAEHAEAVAALVATDAPVAYSLLIHIASDEHSPADTRALCLRALTTACRDAVGGRHEARLLGSVAACCSGLLQSDTAEEVLLAALETVANLHLNRLGLLAAAFCTPQTPWPLARAAIAALDALNLPRPAALVQECRRSRAARLVVVEESLPDSPAVNAQSERLELLDALAPSEKLRQLLARRYCFDIGELVGDLIEREIHAVAPSDELEQWEAVVRGVAVTTEPLGILHDPDPITAAAALHRLLRAGPEAVAAAFEELAQPGALDEAGRVAAIVRVLPPERLPQAAAFARSLHPTADTPDGLEGLASLIHSLFLRDPAQAAVIARQTHRELAAHGREDRRRWPWADALRRCASSAPALESLLRSADESDHEAALDILGDHAFLLLGAPGPRLDRSLVDQDMAALGTLTADCPPEEVSRAAVLAAAAGSGSAVPILLRSAEQQLAAPAGTAVVTLPGLGDVETSPTAELLAAAGYLARTAAPSEAIRVHQWLAALDTGPDRTDVAVGRLIGLAYLGDWLPLLAAVPGGPPRLSAIAHNTVAHWLPGPCPSARGAGPGEVADWIGRRLTADDLGPEARSSLFDLRRRAELRAERASDRRLAAWRM